MIVDKINNQYDLINRKLELKFKLSIYELLILMGCILVSIMMLTRVFYGTEITDEAYYISDAIQMIEGNVPYAYNNFSYGTGSAFLIIPFLFVYGLIVPDNSGVFLYTRICFMLLWYLCLLLGYRILKKNYKKKNAMLVTGLLIPWVAGCGVYNFSYNSIPAMLSYISCLYIYDAIEHKNKWSRLKLVASGFILCVAVFAHPGYGVAVIILGILVTIRTRGIKEKIINIAFCSIGGILEILTVFVPIALQTGFDTLRDGISEKIFNLYPSGSMTEVDANSRLLTFLNAIKPFSIILVLGIIFVYIFAQRYIQEKKIELEKKEYVEIAIATAALGVILIVSIRRIFSGDLMWSYGLMGFLIVCAAVITGVSRNHVIVCYIGIYPIVFSIAQLAIVDSSSSVYRFNAAVPSLAVILLILLESKSELARWITTCCICLCIIALGYSDYYYMYRDSLVIDCDYKVERGVYKGIYTTQVRANDLPELEEYLNTAIGDDEEYAFRDNVPAAYLMMHHGTMVDKATWDCLNYSYHKNAPDTLYAYYVRRGTFPKKYIYIDFGRDENLSCEDEDYKLNEFIDTYYEKTEDFALNEIFYHIVVYEYKGGFDGDFDYWIERHMYKAED